MVSQKECNRCRVVTVLKEEEYYVSDMTRVSIKGRDKDLCPPCYKGFEEIKEHHANKCEAELYDWLLREVIGCP